MKKLFSFFLALATLLGILPTAVLAANPSTIKLDDCSYNGVKYESPALGVCYLHQMQFSYKDDSIMGFCAEHGKGMGWSLEGHTWDDPKPVNDPTIKIMVRCV